MFNQCERGKYDRVYKPGARTPSLGHCKCFDTSAEENQEPAMAPESWVRGSIPCEIYCKRFTLAAVLSELRGLRVKAGRSVSAGI